MCIAWKADGCGFESHPRQPILLPCLSQHLLKQLFMYIYINLVFRIAKGVLFIEVSIFQAVLSSDISYLPHDMLCEVLLPLRTDQQMCHSPTS